MADKWTPGKQLKMWRGKRTAAEVAAALGVTTQTLSNWETDRFQPHISKSASIEDLYGLKRGMVAALLQGDAPPDELIEPNAIGIIDGRLQWSARQLVSDGKVTDFPPGVALNRRYVGSYAADAVRDDVSLDATQKETLLRIIESFQFENRTRGAWRPDDIDVEPEGP